MAGSKKADTKLLAALLPAGGRLPSMDDQCSRRHPVACFSNVFQRSTVMKTISSFIAVAALAAAPAFAQQSGLVNVDIRNVANNIAQNLKVDVSQIPVNVQVPVDVAANVCGVAANVLGTQAASGAASCTANSTSTALNEVVQKQIKKG
jgi:hypothetical protein